MKVSVPYFRIIGGLSSLTLCALLVALVLGLIPDPAVAILQGRMRLTETIGIHSSVAAQRQDFEGLTAAFRAEVDRTPDLESIALWGRDGKVLAAVGDPGSVPAEADIGHSTPTNVRVTVATGKGSSGLLELRFRTSPFVRDGWGLIGRTSVALIGFITLGTFLLHGGYLWFTFRRYVRTTASVAPERVRAALNTLVEGVLILDREQQIVLSNEAFASLANQSVSDLEGRSVSDLPWDAINPAMDRQGELPWNMSTETPLARIGQILRLNAEPASARMMSVNTTRILADEGDSRGTLVTFDDLTNLERKNSEMRKVLNRLRRSQAEIRQQNEKLRTLATRDPLTSCLNRRAFFGEFERLWATLGPDGSALGCVMVDIDHFKAVNDNHGHATGDAVLREVAAILSSQARSKDLVCRYGGEEFCVVLPNGGLEATVQVAQRFREAIEAGCPGGLAVTVSLGVSTTALGPREPRELLDQADKALYASKRNGRNRVTRFDELHADFTIHKEPLPPSDRSSLQTATTIPFPAVTALLSALAYRDISTAEHSVRVADLCVLAAEGLISRSQCYVLEVAGLLHDIGKLGVPDAILRKPGPLTAEEWKVIRTHEAIGDAILTAAFLSEELTAIARNHHTFYGGPSNDSGFPVGEQIPLAPGF